jgi:hypothetical protein
MEITIANLQRSSRHGVHVLCSPDPRDTTAWYKVLAHKLLAEE